MVGMSNEGWVDFLHYCQIPIPSFRNSIFIVQFVCLKFYSFTDKNFFRSFVNIECLSLNEWSIFEEHSSTLSTHKFTN